MAGPLTGLRVVEFEARGAAPFCGMLLSDLGADVVRIDRPDSRHDQPDDLIRRGRRSVALDLKRPEAIKVCLQMFERADALIEAFRPGVMERLGLGPDTALERNPRLVYGRMTGWGQTGPLAEAAAHDINYIAISGALHAIGPAERPVNPLNLAGDFGGGALYLAFGLMAGVIHARETGRGQVVDAAMSEGAASLMTMFYGLKAAGLWGRERAANLLDGGAPFYGVYQCADGAWISLGAIEPKFYAVLREKLGLDDPAFDDQYDRAAWPAQRAKVAAVIAGRTREEWRARLEGTDACFAPVLDMDEAPQHPQNLARDVFVTMGGVVQPAPVPRFSETPGAIQGPPPRIGGDTRAALQSWGLPPESIAAVTD